MFAATFSLVSLDEAILANSSQSRAYGFSGLAVVRVNANARPCRGDTGAYDIRLISPEDRLMLLLQLAVKGEGSEL